MRIGTASYAEVEASVSSLVALAVSQSDGELLRCELGARVPEYQPPSPAPRPNEARPLLRERGALGPWSFPSRRQPPARAPCKFNRSFLVQAANDARRHAGRHDLIGQVLDHHRAGTHDGFRADA